MKKIEYKWIVLSCTTLGVLISIMSGSTLIIALPAIMKDLRAGMGIIMWVIMEYLLSITVLVPTIGRIADIIGTFWVLFQLKEMSVLPEKQTFDWGGTISFFISMLLFPIALSFGGFIGWINPYVLDRQYRLRRQTVLSPSQAFFIIAGVACHMKSFGVPFLSPIAPRTKINPDIIIKQPSWRLEKRGDFLNTPDRRRQPRVSRGWAKRNGGSQDDKGR